MFSATFSARSIAAAEEAVLIVADSTTPTVQIRDPALVAASARWVKNLVELTVATSLQDRMLRNGETDLDQLTAESNGIFRNVKDALPVEVSPEAPADVKWNAPVHRGARAERLLLEVGSAAVQAMSDNELCRLFGAVRGEAIDGRPLRELVTIAIETERRKLAVALDYDRSGQLGSFPVTNLGLPPGSIAASPIELERLLRQSDDQLGTDPRKVRVHDAAVRFICDTYVAVAAFRDGDQPTVDRLTTAWLGDAGELRERTFRRGVMAAVRQISRRFPMGLLSHIALGQTERVETQVQTFGGMHQPVLRPFLPGGVDPFNTLLGDHFFQVYYDRPDREQQLEDVEMFAAPVDHRVVADLMDGGLTFGYEMHNVQVLRMLARSSHLFDAAQNVSDYMSDRADRLDNTLGTRLRSADGAERRVLMHEITWLNDALLPEHAEELLLAVTRATGTTLPRDESRAKALGRDAARLAVLPPSRWLDSAAASSLIDEIGEVPDVDVVTPRDFEVPAAVPGGALSAAEVRVGLANWWFLHALRTGSVIHHRSILTEESGQLHAVNLRSVGPAGSPVEYDEVRPAIAFVHQLASVYAVGELIALRADGTWEPYNFGTQAAYPPLPADVGLHEIEPTSGPRLSLSDESRDAVLRAVRFVRSAVVEPLPPLDGDAIAMGVDISPTDPAEALVHARVITNVRRLHDNEGLERQGATPSTDGQFLNAGAVAHMRVFDVAANDPTDRIELAQKLADIDAAHASNGPAATWATQGVFFEPDGLAGMAEVSRSPALWSSQHVDSDAPVAVDVSSSAQTELALHGELQRFAGRQFDPAALTALLADPEQGLNRLSRIEAEAGPDGPSLPGPDDGLDGPGMPEPGDGDVPGGPAAPPVKPSPAVPAVPTEPAAEPTAPPAAPEETANSAVPRPRDLRPQVPGKSFGVNTLQPAPGSESGSTTPRTPESSSAQAQTPPSAPVVRKTRKRLEDRGAVLGKPADANDAETEIDTSGLVAPGHVSDPSGADVAADTEIADDPASPSAKPDRIDPGGPGHHF